MPCDQITPGKIAETGPAGYIHDKASELDQELGFDVIISLSLRDTSWC